MLSEKYFQELLKKIDKEAFYDSYCIKLKTFAELQKEFHIGYKAILQIAEYYGFSRDNNVSNIAIDRLLNSVSKEQLQELYCIKLLSRSEIANILNISLIQVNILIDKYQLVRDEDLFKQKSAEKVKQTNLSKYGVTCSAQSEAVQEKIKRTNLERYGVEYAFQADEVKEKIRQTNLERYGVENPAVLDEVKDKIKNTFINKYGVENPMFLQETIERIKQTTLERFGVENPFQSAEIKEKIRATNKQKYGKEYITQTDLFKEKSKQSNLLRFGCEYSMQSPEIQNQIKQTNLDRYGVEHPAQNNEVMQKMIDTNLNRYGVEFGLASEEIRNKIKETNLQRYGVECVTNDPEIHRKQLISARNSKLEKRMQEFLNNNKIPNQHQYVIKDGDLIHAFDFAVFDAEGSLQLLIDCDGIYYHGYISDLSQRTDNYRQLLAPLGIKFLVCVEDNEEQCYKDILHYINIDYDTYVQEIFDWCRQYEFPYPKIDRKVLIKSYDSLCKYDCSKFSVNSRPGMKIVDSFHKSIWKSNRLNRISPYEAWQNDQLLLKCIKNRVIYKGTSLYPEKVLAGFSVCRIAPKVSVFNPYLAKYLINKYLNEFETIFDPCSGFSGRLLGASSLGKKYIGQDINEQIVKESNEIIDEFNLDAAITCKNSLESVGAYDCLFTCSPYSNKENWNQTIKELTCDEWITACINNYKCKKYLFVVDNTELYKDYIVEEIVNKSHFNHNKEYVILIEEGI